MRKIRILFLVASPFTTTRSELDAKMHAIRHELQGFRNLVFDSEWVTSIDDLREELDFYQPHVVHFIGHGTSEGIAFAEHVGGLKPVGDRALSLWFNIHGSRTRLVVLDNCYIPTQASTLTEVVDYVIGIKDSAGTSDALHFATLLYSNISRGCTIEQAFDDGKAAISSAIPCELRKNMFASQDVLLPATRSPLTPSNPRMSPSPTDQGEREHSADKSRLPRPEPIDLFITYADEDQELRDQLMKHLRPLINQELIAVYPDGNVSREKAWQQSIERFNKAKVILLLISPDFIVSAFASSSEMRKAIARHERGEAYVLPVILRPVLWEGAPYAHLPMLPGGGKPIIEWSTRDEAFAEVVRGTRMVVVEELEKAGPTPPRPLSEPPSTEQQETPTPPPAALHVLNDVFVKSGVPDVTFVEIEDFERLKLALMQKGRGVIIEGPSGIGKTTAVLKAIKEIEATLGSAETTITMLSARNPAHLERLEALETWQNGTVIIDDFHRLDAPLSQKIANYLKLLADTQPEAKKLVIVGIPQSGQVLAELAYDLATRIDVFRWGKVKNELVVQMIEKGEQALNIKLDRKAELVLKAVGSFNMAQFLCFYVCQQEKVFLRQGQLSVVHCDVSTAISHVQDDLSTKFGDATERFANLGGPRDNTCLRLLEELAASEDGLLSLTRLKESKYELAHGIERFINGQWLEALYQELPESKNYFFFQPSTSMLVSDDPQFTFYLKNISFPELAKKGNKVVAFKRQKVFLCHCGHKMDKKWLGRLQTHLKPLQFEGIIDPWDITQTPPGTKHAEALQMAIETAAVAILLVSANFLASDSIIDNQLPRLLSRAQSGGTTIISLIIEPCLFEGSKLENFQPANPPNRPLSKMTRVQAEETLVKLVEVIREKLQAAQI